MLLAAVAWGIAAERLRRRHSGRPGSPWRLNQFWGWWQAEMRCRESRGQSPQPLEDALGRMALPGWALLAAVQNHVDDGLPWFRLRSAYRLARARLRCVLAYRDDHGRCQQGSMRDASPRSNQRRITFQPGYRVA